MVRREQAAEEPVDVTGMWSAGFRLVATFGAPTVISLALVYWIAVQVTNDLRARQMEHEQIMLAIQRVNDNVLENRNIYLREMDRARGLMYRICVNGATTPHELAVCNYAETPDSDAKVQRK